LAIAGAIAVQPARFNAADWFGQNGHTFISTST
jgi:hypothetical protein